MPRVLEFLFCATTRTKQKRPQQVSWFAYSPDRGRSGKEFPSILRVDPLSLSEWELRKRIRRGFHL